MRDFENSFEVNKRVLVGWCGKKLLNFMCIIGGIMFFFFKKIVVVKREKKNKGECNLLAYAVFPSEPVLYVGQCRVWPFNNAKPYILHFSECFFKFNV